MMERLEQTLSKIEVEARAIEAALAARDRLIIEAAHQGASTRQIAEFAGLSHAGVAKIIRGAEATARAV